MSDKNDEINKKDVEDLGSDTLSLSDDDLDINDLDIDLADLDIDKELESIEKDDNIFEEELKEENDEIDISKDLENFEIDNSEIPAFENVENEEFFEDELLSEKEDSLDEKSDFNLDFDTLKIDDNPDIPHDNILEEESSNDNIFSDDLSLDDSFTDIESLDKEESFSDDISLDDDTKVETDSFLNSSFKKDESFNKDESFSDDISFDEDDTKAETVSFLDDNDTFHDETSLNVQGSGEMHQIENIEDLDLKTDLGLKDELSLSDEENKIIIKDEDINFDFIEDDEKFKDIFEEEYGVDLKSGPETITAVTSDFDSGDLLDEDEITRKLEEDENVLNLKLPEKSPLTIDDDQLDYLKKDLETEDMIDFTDSEIENLSLESLEDNAMESVPGKEPFETTDFDKKEDIDLSEDQLFEEDLKENFQDRLVL
jgi:hypothetical protein